MNIRQGMPEDAPGIARVHVDTWRSTYGGIIPESYLADLSYDRSAEWWQRGIERGQGGVFTFVAESTPENGEAPEILGFATGGPARDDVPGLDGELYAIYMRPEWQGKKIGRELMGVVARELQERGMQGMLVWVLAENPGRYFYEHCGGVEVMRKTITIGGRDLEEIGYGWYDLAPLLEIRMDRNAI